MNFSKVGTGFKKILTISAYATPAISTMEAGISAAILSFALTSALNVLTTVANCYKLASRP